MRSGIGRSLRNLYNNEQYDVHVRLTIENGNGTAIYIHTKIRSLNLELPSPSEPIASLTLDFFRENTKDGPSGSLAPTIAASTFNKLDDGITYSPLLQLGRKVVLDVTLTAIGANRRANTSNRWTEIFQGYITRVSWPQWDSQKAQIQCNDLGGLLQLHKSETKYTYAAGTSIEDTARDILDNHGFNGVVLYFPSATNKVLQVDYAPGLQKSVWSQLWDLATSFGWIVYYRYRGINRPELTFFAPNRGKTSIDQTISRWWDISQLDINEDEVRNVGYVQYYDLDSALQIVGPTINQASITKYGGMRRTFWITLEPESPVRTSSEAQALLTAAVSDVSNPDAILQITSRPLVFLEAGVDLYTYKQKGVFFDSDQQFAPFRSTFTINQERAFSTTQVRGLPTAGMGVWGNFTHIVGPEIPVPIVPDPFLLTYAEVTVNQITGAATLSAAAPSVIKSVAYAYNINSEDIGDFPGIAEVEAQGTASNSGGGLVTSFTADGEFSLTWPANTVAFGEAIRVLLIGYGSLDGTGVHGQPLGAKGSRFQVVLEDQIADGVLVADALIADAKRQTNDLVWKADSWQSVSWTAGTLVRTEDSTSFAILAGSTGNLGSNAPRYVYFDPDVSTTQLQVAVALKGTRPKGKQILVATAWRSLTSGAAYRASVVPASGELIITAAMIAVAYLSSITANIGEVVAGKIRSGNSRFSIDLDATGDAAFLSLKDASNNFVVKLLADGSAVFAGEVAAQSFTGANPKFDHSLSIKGGESKTRISLSAVSTLAQIALYGSKNGVHAGRATIQLTAANDLAITGTEGVTIHSGSSGIQVGVPGSKIGFFGVTPVTRPTVT